MSDEATYERVVVNLKKHEDGKVEISVVEIVPSWTWKVESSQLPTEIQDAHCDSISVMAEVNTAVDFASIISILPSIKSWDFDTLRRYWRSPVKIRRRYDAKLELCLPALTSGWHVIDEKKIPSSLIPDSAYLMRTYAEVFINAEIEGNWTGDILSIIKLDTLEEGKKVIRKDYRTPICILYESETTARILIPGFHAELRWPVKLKDLPEALHPHPTSEVLVHARVHLKEEPSSVENVLTIIEEGTWELEKAERRPATKTA